MGTSILASDEHSRIPLDSEKYVLRTSDFSLAFPQAPSATCPKMTAHASVCPGPFKGAEKLSHNKTEPKLKSMCVHLARWPFVGSGSLVIRKALHGSLKRPLLPVAILFPSFLYVVFSS